jgi:ATP-dependent RNA helicase DDX27
MQRNHNKNEKKKFYKRQAENSDAMSQEVEDDDIDVRIENPHFFDSMNDVPTIKAPVKQPSKSAIKKGKVPNEKQNVKNHTNFSNPEPDTDVPDLIPFASEEKPKINQPAEYFDFNVWHDMGLIKPLIKALSDLGFARPTKIQQLAVPYIFSGKDVLGNSVTGSGKTAAFLLPLIQEVYKINALSQTTSAVVILPTRELAIQCFEMFRDLNKYTKLSASVVIGKSNLEKQEKELRDGPDFIFATPGRLIDLCKNSRGVHLDDVSYLIFDEADKLLEMGFKNEIEEILSMVNNDRKQTLLFSATLNKGVEHIVKLALRRPLRVEANAEFAVATLLRQEVVKLKSIQSDRVREGILVHMLKTMPDQRVIVFFKTKNQCHKFAHICENFEITAFELHGDLNQMDRNRSVKNFIENKGVLLATDLAARGLDFPKVDYVINFNLPIEVTQYIHRIGRTARAGTSGSCITLVTDDEMIDFKRMAKKTKEKVFVRKIDFIQVKPIVKELKNFEPKIKRIFAKEKLIRELEKAEMEASKCQNMLDHEEEIYNRPRREWIVSKAERKSVAEQARKRIKII